MVDCRTTNPRFGMSEKFPQRKIIEQFKHAEIHVQTSKRLRKRQMGKECIVARALNLMRVTEEKVKETSSERVA